MRRQQTNKKELRLGLMTASMTSRLNTDNVCLKRLFLVLGQYPEPHATLSYTELPHRAPEDMSPRRRVMSGHARPDISESVVITDLRISD